MTDWFTASIKLQQRMLDAQNASLSAGQQERHCDVHVM